MSASHAQEGRTTFTTVALDVTLADVMPNAGGALVACEIGSAEDLDRTLGGGFGVVIQEDAAYPWATDDIGVARIPIFGPGFEYAARVQVPVYTDNLAAALLEWGAVTCNLSLFDLKTAGSAKSIDAVRRKAVAVGRCEPGARAPADGLGCLAETAASTDSFVMFRRDIVESGEPTLPGVDE